MRDNFEIFGLTKEDAISFKKERFVEIYNFTHDNKKTIDDVVVENLFEGEESVSFDLYLEDI